MSTNKVLPWHPPICQPGTHGFCVPVPLLHVPQPNRLSPAEGDGIHDIYSSPSRQMPILWVPWRDSKGVVAKVLHHAVCAKSLVRYTGKSVLLTGASAQMGPSWLCG